jgi:hypothetical protein
VEESTVKELHETKRQLQGIIAALSEAKADNHRLRLRIAELERHDDDEAPVTNEPQPEP